jgi:GR25 family glycosyltransferase involved in LPS biosynthesis
MNFEAFEKTYCINLNEDIHNYERISQWYPEVVRFEAIKKSNGRQGCAQSHIEVIRTAKKQGLKNVLILEDDIEVHISRGKKYFDKIFESLESIDWSILKLGYALESDSTGYRLSPEIIQANNTWGMHAYVVNSKYYDTFLTTQRQKEIDSLDVLHESKRVNFTNDSFVHNNDTFKGTTFCCTPLLVVQSDGYSRTSRKVHRRGIRQRRMYRKHIKRFNYVNG